MVDVAYTGSERRWFGTGQCGADKSCKCCIIKQIIQTASLASCVCNINHKLGCAYTSLLVRMYEPVSLKILVRPFSMECRGDTFDVTSFKFSLKLQIASQQKLGFLKLTHVRDIHFTALFGVIFN